jgi:aminopeptidase N
MTEEMHCRAYSAGYVADGRFSYPGSTPHYAPDRLFDTRHIRLELALDFARKALQGKATLTLQAIADGAQTIVFDAVHFQDVKVRAKGKNLKFDYNDRQLKVHWPSPVRRNTVLSLDIHYRVVQPKLGLHFIGPDRQYPSKPVQAWTQGEDEYNRNWFPCHDAPQERATTEMIVTVPARYTAISNGALLQVKRRGKTRTFHWKHQVPHPPYLVSLAVGEFTEIKDRWKRVPVLYFCPPGREEDSRRAFGKTPQMIDFFSKKLRVPYPYAKYSQVAAYDFIYGGMENTSCTTQTALTLHDERAHLDFSSDPLVAHELAHQWFGDLVTCKDWSHAWLNESFATYFEALFREHDLGADEFAYEMRGNAEAYFDEDQNRYRRPLSTKFYKNTNDLFDRHLYEKGSCILHMIRRLLGDRDWWQSIHTYLVRHKAQSVETINLIDAIQDTTGKNMRPFFDEWVFKGGHPDLKIRYWWNAKEKKIFIRLLQTQTVSEETPLYHIPVEWACLVRGQWKRFKETLEKKEHLFSFALPAAPELVLFDPDHSLLKKVDFAKSEEMWIVQLTEDPHVLGRVDAAQALGKLGSPSALQALRQALGKEKFWGVQSDIARALGHMCSNGALEALLDGLRTIMHPKVRRALYEALGAYPSPKVQAEIKSRLATEKSYFAEGEALRALGRMKDPALMSLFKEYLKKESWNDTFRCAALDAIGSLQLAESRALLKQHSRYGFHPNVRMTAIRRLALLGRAAREDIQSHLLELLSDKYLLVQLAVVRALGSFADERATDALMKYTSGDLDGRLKRAAEEAIRKIRKGMEQEFPSKNVKVEKRKLRNES